MIPPPPTHPVIQLARRIFVCRRGHAFMWKRAGYGDYLECVSCLTVRVVPPIITKKDPIHV